MKTPLLILLLATILVSCHDTVQKNKKTIDAVVQTRAVSKSIEVQNYKVNDKIETHDSLTLFITVNRKAGDAYLDTLRFAKMADGMVKP